MYGGIAGRLKRDRIPGMRSIRVARRVYAARIKYHIVVNQLAGTPPGERNYIRLLPTAFRVSRVRVRRDVYVHLVRRRLISISLVPTTFSRQTYSQRTTTVYE